MRAVVVIAFMIGATGLVHADPAASPPATTTTPPTATPPPSPVEEPTPFSFGFALGGGVLALTCPGCKVYGGEAAELHVGWAFSSRFELIAQASGVFHPRRDGNLLSSGSADLVARGWVTPIVWLEGGAGYGRVYASDTAGYALVGDPGFVWSATGGAGWNVYEVPNFALSIELRSSIWFYADPTWDLGLLLGFEFHEPLSWLTHP